MTIYGYCRTSTAKQNVQRQIRNIQDVAKEAVIITEQFTGRSMNRPQWQKIFKAAKAGDRIIFDSVSRMSRDADEGVQIYRELYQRGVTLEFIKEPQVNTETYRQAAQEAVPMTGTEVDVILKAVNAYLLILAEKQIRLAFEQAQKEVDDLSLRTKEGLKTAKLNGRQVGQLKGTTYTTKKSVTAKRIIWENSRTFAGNLKDDDVMRLAGISRHTLYTYKAQIKQDGEPPKPEKAKAAAAKATKTTKATNKATQPES